MTEITSQRAGKILTVLAVVCFAIGVVMFLLAIWINDSTISPNCGITGMLLWGVAAVCGLSAALILEKI